MEGGMGWRMMWDEGWSRKCGAHATLGSSAHKDAHLEILQQHQHLWSARTQRKKTPRAQPSPAPRAQGEPTTLPVSAHNEPSLSPISRGADLQFCINFPLIF